ncbi:MAG: AsmA family protein [Rhodospirillaceae bacterium]|nr:AsmA family protein [Rhodospirillaceae bacterium]MBT5665082.1 AsmA family protein [Rhodospirillaceae bacterium]MBT5811899.1 AsmA family protein [Rhodospirillaceae bacterium]
MKKVLVLLGGFFVLLVAAVLIGPGFIDWNAYKSEITEAVETATGRQLSIDGDLKFAVLPTPALRASGVRLSNIDGAQSPDMLTLKDVRVRVSIADLFQGRIAVERIQLIEPVIALEVLADGRASWDIAPISAAATADSAKADEGQDASGVAISLASLTITDGVLSYRDGAGIERIEGVNAEITADSLQGPFTATLSAIVRGLPVEATLRANSIRANQPIGLNATFGVADLDSRVTFSGQVNNPGPAASLDGKLSVEGANAAEAIRRITGSGGTAILARPFSLSSVVSASQKLAALNDIAVRLGDVSATGAVNLGFGDTLDLDIAVSVNKFDLDAFLASATLNAEPGKTAAGSEKATATAESSKAAPVALPENVNATLDLTIDVLRYNRGVVRQVGLRAAMSNGSITLDRASALLPGGSDVSALGFLQIVDGAPLFEGEIAAASDNLRAVFDWLSIDTHGVSNDRLRGFSYASKIKATPESVEIPDINLRLDASTMTGALALAIRERPGLGLRLAIDRINLDAYLPKSRRNQAAPKTNSGVAKAKPGAGENPPASGANGLALLDTFDANFDASVGRLTVQGATLRKLHAEGLLVGGDVNFSTLRVADAVGVAATLRGDVRGLGGTPAIALDFDVTGKDLSQTFRWLGVKPPLTPKQLGKVTAKGRLDGGLKALSFKASIIAAGSKIALNGALKDIAGAPKIAIGARIDHPDLTKAVRLFAPTFKPAASNLGAVAAAFRMTGNATGLDITEIDAALGPVTVAGSMSVGLGGPQPRIKATLETGEVLTDLFLPSRKPADTARNRQRKANGLSSSAATAGGSGGGAANPRWSREKIDLSGLKGVDADVTLTMAGLIVDRIQLDKPHVVFKLKGGRLNVEKFNAGVLGGAVSGAGVIDSATTPPTFTAALQARDVNSRDILAMAGAPARVSGPISVEFSGAASGATEADLITALNGSARLGGLIQVQVSREERSAADALNIASALFGKKVKELGQVGGASRVLFDAFGKKPATLSGDLSISNGVVTTRNGRLAGAGAFASIAGAVDLPAWRIDSRTSMFQDGGSAPLIYFDVKGSLDTPSIKPGGDILKQRAPATDAKKSNPLQQVLPGLLGGKGASEKPKAKDLIRGLLKGLGG